MRLMSADGLRAAIERMRAGGVDEAAVRVFEHYYHQLESGETGIMHEADLAPLEDPESLETLDISPAAQSRALASTVVLKLNGGLGTGMGIDRAKSLLPVHDGESFLDLIARQVTAARADHGVRLPLVLMDSFRTRDDTLAALRTHAGLEVDGLPLDFLQNREPKLLEDDLTPVDWPKDRDLEWCPPGHGDLYTALQASGVLDELRGHGFHYAFVSNADNLGATLDGRVAGWFADSGAPFAVEVSRRTSADRKGGHLAVRRSDGRLVLRESAQTAPADAHVFSDVSQHRYFNTNNLWLDLDALADVLRSTDGVLGLPMIRNVKTVDPTDSGSPKVVQIETAMGAAVEVFEGSRAIEVPRSRFLPVKSTNDLLALRSDVYAFGADGSVRLASGLDEAPYVDLDPRYFKVLADFEAHFPAGAPSLREATSLQVHGDWTFGRDVRVTGVASLGDPGGNVADGSALP
jgi:UTP--glucose-1-phosphate uridylyltransferase